MNALLTKALVDMDDDELFSLLDTVSEEVKRRNNMLGPSVSDIRNQPVEQTMTTFLEALSSLGVQIRQDKK